MKLENSVVLVTSQVPGNHYFGTGFVIRRSSGAVYILTCAHVVKDVGGESHIYVDGMSATVATSGEPEGLDLAVLKVEGLWQKPPLKLRCSGDRSHTIETIGFQKFDSYRQRRSLSGKLGNQVALHAHSGDRIQAWDLQITDNHPLKPGYSGSPVIDTGSETVIGVVSHLQGQGEFGLAISIEALNQIWRVVDSEQLYRTLMKLGYRQQVRQFTQLIRKHAIAALLIYGDPGYGQKWLLNRLVNQHLPHNLTGKVVKVDLSRRVRRSDVSALWRELARRVGLKGQPVPEEIIQRVYRWWETQNVLLIFHNVDFLPQASFQGLLQDFWLPLASQARELKTPASDYKLLMFLIDYQGRVGDWNAPFVEKIDSRWSPQFPVRSPRLEEFSDNELLDWITDESDELPPEFKNEEEIVEQILKNSDDGIPELVLQEICERCGCDWYEELERWLKL
ncbi:trypsin-like peptidase domain-containing protein [Almyronema epifaneia]|uniref:Trypsin-like peptidase domain-containing protein n=1 Tax=Almyronema epifaneia S1 TaxID=2991925 RepID=A0ABW6IKH2_9CYAN